MTRAKASPDTNTKVIRNDKVSVSCVIHCSVGDVGKKSVTLLYSLLTWYEFINVRGKEENLAWAELIVAIQDNESFSTGRCKSPNPAITSPFVI